jgi:hypothetical protein
MAAVNVDKNFNQLLEDLGRPVLNAIFPKEIEYYSIFLELVNSKGELVDFFTWPINPDSLSETHKELTTIRKTMGGVSVLKNPTFTPRMISLRGDFGQRFKVLLNNQNFEFAGIQLSLKEGKFNISAPGDLETNYPQFSSFAKNGYGCIKVLEAMKEKSKKLDQYNKPFSLYFYNPILGNNYQVEFDTFVHSQDSTRYNMLPSYSMQLTAIAPLDMLFNRSQNIQSNIKNVAFSVLQKKTNALASPIRKALDSIV